MAMQMNAAYINVQKLSFRTPGISAIGPTRSVSADMAIPPDSPVMDDTASDGAHQQPIHFDRQTIL
jgi:hypothetical protein